MLKNSYKRIQKILSCMRFGSPNAIEQTLMHKLKCNTDSKMKSVLRMIPGIDGPPSPMGPPETAGCVTVEGLDIHPASGAGTGAGVG